jgi:hypothetical protein
MLDQNFINLNQQNSNFQTLISHPTSNIQRSPSYESQCRNKIDITTCLLQQQQQYLNITEGVASGTKQQQHQ